MGYNQKVGRWTQLGKYLVDVSMGLQQLQPPKSKAWPLQIDASGINAWVISPIEPKIQKASWVSKNIIVGTVTLNNFIPLFRIALDQLRSYRFILILDPASDSPSAEGMWLSSYLPSTNMQSKLTPMWNAIVDSKCPNIYVEAQTLRMAIFGIRN